MTRKISTGDLLESLTGRGIVAAPIHTVSEAAEFAPIRERLLETRMESGKRVRLPPPSVETAHLASGDRQLPYAPRYGQNTVSVLQEAGLTSDEITSLKESGTIA